jgi:hypothetical protein
MKRLVKKMSRKEFKTTKMKAQKFRKAVKEIK